MTEEHKSSEKSSGEPPAREIILVGAIALGAMLGAGVFVLSGMAAGTAGPALILAFALNGLIALIAGGCYAELSGMMPQAGGAYIFAKPGLGPTAGFFAGWDWALSFTEFAFAPSPRISRD